jgi:acetyltransferase-like isoleucine patch superfamily enzyme
MGNCKVGEESFLGTSSCFKEGTTIEKKSVIGMGSVVISNLETGVYVGNPARQIK